MTTVIKNQEEARTLLESFVSERFSVKSCRKKNLKGNQIKYTIIVEDTAIPEVSPIKSRKNNNKKVTKERELPKEKVVIAKKEKMPIPPARLDMADITHI